MAYYPCCSLALVTLNPELIDPAVSPKVGAALYRYLARIKKKTTLCYRPTIVKSYIHPSL
jgi:hypothetical protein